MRLESACSKESYGTAIPWAEGDQNSRDGGFGGPPVSVESWAGIYSQRYQANRLCRLMRVGTAQRKQYRDISKHFLWFGCGYIPRQVEDPYLSTIIQPLEAHFSCAWSFGRLIMPSVLHLSTRRTSRHPSLRR